MAGPENSCCKWRKILSKHMPKICPPNCFDPLRGPCPDYKIVDVLNLKPKDVKAIPVPEPEPEPLPEPEPEAPVRRIVDTKPLCAKQEVVDQKSKDACNFCCAECRPTSTSLNLKEWTKRPRPKPTYKHSVFLDNKLLVGRAFPLKFCIRRLKNNCTNCGNELLFRDPITENTNVIVLENCCDVKVYPERVLENWHRVPILAITGDKVMKKKTLNEVCKLEPKKVPPIIAKPEPTIEPKPVEPKGKGKGKGKGKKGKK